jgi:hypothetical protein
MTEGDKAGIWAMVYLCIAGIALGFILIYLTIYHFKVWFL